MPSPIEEVEAFLLENGLNRIDFHGTDYAWGFREDEPIIALIQSSDGGAAFQAAMSLYWAAAEYIAKPWCLFLEVEGLALHHRQMLDNLTKQYNIQVLSGDVKLFVSVKNQLNRLVTILEEYIPVCSTEPLKALGDSVKTWREEKPVNEYRYDLEIETGKLGIYEENGALIPSRKTIPLTAASSDVSIEGILPRLVNIEDGLSFDTEHRNLPMVFKLHIGETSQLVTRFEADKSNIIEATSFWGLHQGFTLTNKLAFIEPNTGDILFNCLRGLDDRGTDKNSR
jgi:hypothetical protein